MDYGKVVDEVNCKFAEAREKIEVAMESKETIYFDEEATCMCDTVGGALATFDALLARLPLADADVLHYSMGLKMEQLKAELNSWRSSGLLEALLHMRMKVKGSVFGRKFE